MDGYPPPSGKQSPHAVESTWGLVVWMAHPFAGAVWVFFGPSVLSTQGVSSPQKRTRLRLTVAATTLRIRV
jgi:hypothetical protein